MSTFQYTITKYDNATKTLNVSFGIDGGYAKIVLMDPLPTNQTELESIIKQYVLPQQYVDALVSPVDMSYVDPLVGHTMTCERRSIQTVPAASGMTEEASTTNANTNWNVDNPYGEDPAQAEAAASLENAIIESHNEFEESVLDILRKNGLLK